MSDIEGPASPATGTAAIMDNMTADARPSTREPDTRDPGDIESGRMGVDLLFEAIGAGLCPDDSILAPDRDRLLWNAVEQLRSHVGRLDSRLEHRLREPTPEQREERARENESNAGDTDFLRADQAEATQAQLRILRDTLDHAMQRYGEAVGQPWIARHGTVDPGPSAYGLGVQIDASTFFAARELWQPSPVTLTRVREAMEDADLKRAAVLAAAQNRDAPTRLQDLPFPYNAGEREPTAAAVTGMFQALSLIYPSGTQLQDERDAGSWRLVRMFDAGAARATEDALRRMTDHPALTPTPDPDAAASFNDGTHSSMLRVQMLSRAADAAGAVYQEITGDEWDRRDPAMTAAGGPRIRTSLTSRHYAAAHRVAALGHPTPHQLDGPHIVIVGNADLDMERNRRAVETQLERLHDRVPEMVLHYGARLRDRGGVDRQQGIDAIVYRWASGRGVPLIPNPPLWDAANNRFDLHGRDDTWIHMNPDLVVDFGGSGNAHRRFLSLVNQNRIELRTARTRSQAQNREDVSPTASETPQPSTSPRALRWAGIGARKTPEPVLADMTELARRMSDAGFHLSSGGARGADTAFAAGVPADRRSIWLPWAGYNNLRGADCQTLPPERLQDCMEVARRLHPNWDNCSPAVRALHARNVAILLGPNLDNPVDAVVCWTEGGRRRGGTGLGIRIAQDWNIPVINLATVSTRQAWDTLQRLQQTPNPSHEAATTTRDRVAPEQRRALRRDRAVTRLHRMLRDHDIRDLPRFALAQLREENARAQGHEFLDSMSRDELLDALDNIEDQTRQLRDQITPDGPATPQTIERDKRIAALEAAGDRIHAVLADKNLSALREQESPDTQLSTDERQDKTTTQRRVLSIMVSAWRLAEEGPLAAQSNRIVKAAAQVFASQQTYLSGKLADETRIRSGLGLAHTPGSEEETLALASRGPGQNPGKDAEPFEHMLTDVEIKQKDQEYYALAIRSRRLDLMADTAQTFAHAAHQDMRRGGADRDRRSTRHLEGANTASAIQERQDELRAAHRQLIDDVYRHIVSLCPDDHVSAADPNHTASSDRDQLLSRFAGVFRSLEQQVDTALMHASRSGKNARNIGQLREAASCLRDLANYAEQTLNKHTSHPPHTWSPRRTTQTAGEWLMERQRRALHRQKAETLAPNGHHVAIVGGRRLSRQHAGRIAELLNRERAANPDKPLVLHCIAQEGAGHFAAEWAASHAVACVTHRPKSYSPQHLKRRDNLLLGIPPDTVWNFGSEGSHERAAQMLLERAAEQAPTLQIRDVASELDGPLSGDIAISPREDIHREYQRIHHAWEKANALAGNAPIIYQEGVAALLPDINTTLTSPHLAGNERRFLTSLKALIETEDLLRGDIASAIGRARDHLASYEAMLERRGPHQPGTILNDVDLQYRRWDVHAEQILKTFDNWFAIDNPIHREHIDRRHLDLVDLSEELRAIREAARDPRAELHRVEIPLESIGALEDQRFDRRHFTEITLKALKPEEERNPQAVAEFARWARAWPDKALSTFRQIAAAAAEAKQPLHTERLTASLPPHLAAGMSHISKEVWGNEARVMMQRHAVRNHGMGLSA